MSDVLIRGLPPRVHRQIHNMAEAQQLSVNQLLIRLLAEAVKQKQEGEEKRRRDEEAFRRLQEIRERFHKKYGRFDESWKLIREDRESH